MARHVLKYSKHAVYHRILTKIKYEEYIDSLNIPKKEPYSVLDVGCGEGKVLFEILYPLLPKNCKEIIALDIDDSMIQHCQSFYKKPNVSFYKMDIGSNHVPEPWVNRFHVIFSSYCFMYVRNLSLCLTNCRRMLKPKGDIFMLFISKKNPLYTTYSELSKIEMWKPYTQEFKDFVPHFSSPDPDVELNSLFEQVDLQVLSREFLHDFTFESEERNFVEVFKSMDRISRIIPEEKRKKYDQDFQNIFSEVSGLNISDDSKMDRISKMHIPTVVIHARKS